MKSKKKFNLKHKGPLAIAAILVTVALAGGGYYLYTQKSEPVITPSIQDGTTTTTTDAQVEQNVEQKSGATTGATATPAVTAEKANTTTLADVSLSVLRSENTAEVILYGPSGTYAIDKLVGGTWTTIQSNFVSSSRDPRSIDTIQSAASETHYKISLIQNGARVATSGDTIILWQQILNNNGTLSVPLAE